MFLARSGPHSAFLNYKRMDKWIDGEPNVWILVRVFESNTNLSVMRDW